MSSLAPSVLGSCSGCGKDEALRDGLCRDCWYASADRPKPVRDRYAKLARLEDLGVAPYAYGFDRTHTLPEALAAYEDEEGEMNYLTLPEFCQLENTDQDKIRELNPLDSRLEKW